MVDEVTPAPGATGTFSFTPAAFRRMVSDTRGIIDLASVLVGIFVLGIISAIISAAIFAAIPWAQDNAARGNLELVASSQQAVFAFGNTNTFFSYDSHKDSAYRPVEVNGVRLQQPVERLVVGTGVSGQYWIGAQKSESGKVFYRTSASDDVFMFDPLTFPPGGFDSAGAADLLPPGLTSKLPAAASAQDVVEILRSIFGGTPHNFGPPAAPTAVIAPAESAITVPLRWTASFGGVIPDGYFVTRSNGTTVSPACDSSVDALISETSCVDRPAISGNYTYAVTAVRSSSTASSAPSATVQFVTGINLSFDVQPSTTPATVGFSPPVRVAAMSAGAGSIPVEGVVVDISLDGNSEGAVLSGTLTATTDASGIATFEALSVDRIGGAYILAATTPGSAAITSEPFAITTPPLAGVNLGSAGTFSALGVSATNAGPSSLAGNLGVSALSVVGFTSGMVLGQTHTGNADATRAMQDFFNAYDDAIARPADTVFAGDPNGRTFLSGVHRTDAALALAAAGTITLDAQNNPNAVFIFQIGGALNTGAASNINLINGAKASNVYWAAVGATGIGASASFTGTILATGAFTLGAGATLNGRALSKAAVGMDSATIRFAQ